MAEVPEELLRRVDERMAELGLNDRQVSLGVTGKPDFLRDLRRRSALPRGDRLHLLAEVLGTTSQWLLTGAEPDSRPADRVAESRVSDPFHVFRHERPKDVPVRGTPSCGEREFDGQHIESVEMDLGEIVDYVRRPAALDGRQDVYAIYFTGFSMEPRYEQGEVAYVDTRRPPAIGDYVVVQLTDGINPRIVHALVKRLVRRTIKAVTLEQFNPPATFEVPVQQIAAIHRIFPLAELAGI